MVMNIDERNKVTGFQEIEDQLFHVATDRVNGNFINTAIKEIEHNIAEVSLNCMSIQRFNQLINLFTIQPGQSLSRG